MIKIKQYLQTYYLYTSADVKTNIHWPSARRRTPSCAVPRSARGAGAADGRRPMTCRGSEIPMVHLFADAEITWFPGAIGEIPWFFHASIMFNPYFFWIVVLEDVQMFMMLTSPWPGVPRRAVPRPRCTANGWVFLGKITGHLHISWENPWFPVRIFPIKPVHWATIHWEWHCEQSPFYWINCWTSSRRTIMILHPNWINLHFNFWCHAIQLQLTGDVIFLGICFCQITIYINAHQCS